MREQKDSESQAMSRSTGPRTEAGKPRSKNNALKSGLFARAALLPGESRVEYEALRRGLWDVWRPVGALEVEDVEYLVSLYWQRRRVAVAERAEVAVHIEFDGVDSVEAQVREAWVQSRAGETTGGMLQHGSNPFVLRDVIDMLTVFRTGLEKHGFHANEDAWILRKVYGLDHDGSAPMSLFRTATLQSKLATGGRIGNAEKYDNLRKNADDLKAELIEEFDEELKRLKILETLQQGIADRRRQLSAVAASVLPDGSVDRFIRVRTHLSREIDKTVSRLERTQRRRTGQPEPPTMELKLNV